MQWWHSFYLLDTITYKDSEGNEKCLDVRDSSRIYFPLSFSVLDSATWKINGDTVRKGFTGIDSNGKYFRLSDYIDEDFPDEYAIIEANLPNGVDKITFKFRICKKDFDKTIIYCCEGELHYYDYSHLGDLTEAEIEDLITELTDACRCFDCEKTFYRYEFCPGRFKDINITCKTFLVFLVPALAAKICKCSNGEYIFLGWSSCDPEPECPCEEGIIQSVTAVPNPDLHGNMSINYVFNHLPAGDIKVSITDLHGIERLEVYNGMVYSLAGSFPTNVNHFPAGYYLIKFEATAEGETISIPFIKQ